MNDNAKNQAAAQLSSIRNMLAAISCDYDRLEELRGFADGDLSDDDREELVQLEESAGECTSEDEARERIQYDPLSVQVRSGWYTPGETPEAEEFEILLCTGGPAVRIMGELDEHNQPFRAWLQYQDWGTPWTDYFEEGAGAACLEYAQQFYFGE